MVDKIFHHGHHKEGEQATGQQQQAGQGQAQQPHKETEGEKFKEYMAEEKRLDEEGKEYGGLMWRVELFPNFMYAYEVSSEEMR